MTDTARSKRCEASTGEARADETNRSRDTEWRPDMGDDIDIITDTANGELLEQRAEAIRKATNGWLIGLRSQNTRRAYTNALKMWMRWCGDAGVDPVSPTAHEVGAWVTWMAEVRKYSPDTMRQFMGAVKGWHTELQLEGLRPNIDVHSRVNRPRATTVSTTRLLSDAEVQSLIDAARQRRTPVETALLLMATMGLRASEAGSVTGNELQRSPVGTLLRVNGKGGKVAVMPVPQVVLDAAERVRWPGWDLHLFAKQTVDRPYRRIVGWCEPVAAEAGIDDFHPHMLRHWFVTVALREGVDERHVQDSARHSSMDTTRRYDRLQNQIANHASHTVGRLIH
jgi:integrase/recombinase XerD